MAAYLFAWYSLTSLFTNCLQNCHTSVRFLDAASALQYTGRHILAKPDGILALPFHRRNFLQLASAGLCLPRLARAATLVRSPYLQNVQADRASVLWTTQAPGSGSVTLTGPNGSTITAPANMTGFQPSDTQMPSAFYQYQADFTGLLPGREYRYAVTVDGQVLASDPTQFWFRTAAQSKFSFLVLGDSGASSPEQQMLVQLMSAEASASMVVHVGDMAYPNGTFGEFDSAYYGMNAPLMRRLPFFSAPGNHEYYTGFAAPYLAGISVPESGVPVADQGRYYSFDRGHAHFVSLDSNLLATSSATEMLAWLDADLAATSQYWRIVFLHHTPYPTSFHLGDPLCAAVQQFVNPIVERHGVQLVLAGHEHGYERSYPLAANQPVESSAPSTIYLVTGGGGASLESVSTSAQCALSVEAFNYLRVEVDSRELIVTAIGLDGGEIDRVSLSASKQMSLHRVVSMGETAEIAAGSLLSISGTNLAARSAESPSYPLSTRLSGVEVRVGGRALPLLSVSAAQIRAQMPYEVSGSMALEISTPHGFASGNITVSPTAPSLLAIHSAGAPFTSLNPARPGGKVALYLTGLGKVEGAIELGHAAPFTPQRVTAPVEVWLGNIRIQPAFAGLQPGAAGVYRVDLAIPQDLRDGIYALRVVAGGVSSRPANLDVITSGDGDRHDRARSKVQTWGG